MLSEIKNLTGLIIGITKNKNAPILILGMTNYIILFSIEAVKYIEENKKIEISYKYKKQLNNSRARIKESAKDCNGMLEDIKRINEKTYNKYYEKCSNLAKKYFSFLITNLGVYFYKDNIIGNTFLYEMNNKKIFLTDKTYDKEKTRSVAIELGMMLKKILNRFNEIETSINVNINYNINSKDYDVYTKCNLINSNIELNLGLLLLNIFSTINFYKYIISEFDICDSLKYRIAYCIFYKTYSDLKEISKENKDFNDIFAINKYTLLYNKDFRNNMFHYNFQNDLEEIDENEMYYGLINKQLKITEEEFKKILNDYINEIHIIINEMIF